MSELIKYIQDKVVFLPVALSGNHQFPFEYEFEEYMLETPFGGKINAVHFKIESPKGIILYFHGNADNLERWGKIAGDFTKFGYDVLVMDYRGYGKSSGERNEEFLYSDAQFFYEFAKENYGEQNIVVYGRSLGGAFAVKVAGDNQPKLVILEATFFNLQDIVNRWIPTKASEKFYEKMTYQFLSNESILNIQTPLFHFHGDKDFVVPIKSGRKLFDIFEKEQPDIQKKFITIKGGSHNDLIKFEKFNSELIKILSR